jgi:hypothetical protein
MSCVGGIVGSLLPSILGDSFFLRVPGAAPTILWQVEKEGAGE